MGQQIHWFPGHMNKALNEVENKVKLVDVVIELFDSRAPISSINENLGNITANKKKLVVLTKTDLADPVQTKKWMEELSKQFDAIVSLDLKSANAESVLSKTSIHFLVWLGSARSVLVNTTSFFLFAVILPKFSLIEEIGARASKSSIITSTSLTLFSTSFRALFMCPGNQ